MIIRYSPRSENLKINEKSYIDRKLKKVQDLLKNRGEENIRVGVEVNKYKHLWNLSTSITTPQKSFRVNKQDRTLLRAADMTESVLTKQIRESFGKDEFRPIAKVREAQSMPNAPVE